MPGKNSSLKGKGVIKSKSISSTFPQSYRASGTASKSGLNANAKKGDDAKKKKKRKKNRFLALKIIFLLLVVIIVVAGAGALTIVYSYVKDTPEFNPGLLRPSITSYIYDRDGNELTGLYDEQNRIEVPLESIPAHVQNAFIAIEDERFFDHLGVDPMAIARAFLINLRQRDWTEQGGSTITQQLIKNAFLSPEKTYRRKVQEAWLAIKMERQYSKPEILEIYLNQIPFAHGAYGIEAAANTYFNKSADELTIAEAALLAGVPRAPNYYSPYINPDVSMHRQGLVLHKMFELGYISFSELQQARNEELVLAERTSREYSYPYFIDYVLHHELISILTAIPEYGSRQEAYEAIYNMGLRIYTTMDKTVQAGVEDILNDESLYPQTIRVDMEQIRQMLGDQNLSNYPAELIVEDGVPQPQSAAVVANPVTGEVLALIGGREYSKHNQTLRYLSRRQPGSAIKPIVGYAPAMEEGLLTPGSIIDDAPFARGSWAPENFDRRFRGLVTVREALVRSLNIPAVKAFQLVTPQIGLDYAERMGLSTIHNDDYNLATGIGGMTHGVTALDMASAYGVLANQGIRLKLFTVKRIEDPAGKVIFEHRSEPEAVLTPQTAYLTTDILKDVVRHGTAARLRVGRPVAAKTGTTSDNRDAYLVAYTPELVVSFWMGHDIQSLGRIAGGSGATIDFMNAIMNKVLEDVPPTDFLRPSGISGSVSICNKSGLRPGPHCPPEAITSEIFSTALIPQDTCNLHVEMYVCSASNLLPGEFCPEHYQVAEKFLLRPEFEITDNRWRGGQGRSPEDVSLLPPEDTCTLHTRPAPQPTGFTAYLLPAPLRAHLWWTQEVGTREYLLYRRDSGEEEYLLLDRVPGTTNQYLDTNLKPGMIYFYRLIALNLEGVRSEPSESILYTPRQPVQVIPGQDVEDTDEDIREDPTSPQIPAPPEEEEEEEEQEEGQNEDEQ